MTTPESSNPRAHRGAVWAVRRALAPGALELEGTATRLNAENAGLRAEVEELRQRLGSIEERLGKEIAELKDGLHEARRLNLRIAELTDLVTELVLPLHDREIDPGALAKLRPDTL